MPDLLSTIRIGTQPPRNPSGTTSARIPSRHHPKGLRMGLCTAKFVSAAAGRLTAIFRQQIRGLPIVFPLLIWSVRTVGAAEPQLFAAELGTLSWTVTSWHSCSESPACGWWGEIANHLPIPWVALACVLVLASIRGLGDRFREPCQTE